MARGGVEITMGIEGNLIVRVAPEANPLDQVELLALPPPTAGDVVDNYS
jgi:hypothetical protein